MPFTKNPEVRMEILDIIDTYTMQHEGMRPSTRRIATLRGRSVEPTHRLMKELEAEGLLKRASGEPFASDWTLTMGGRTALEQWRKNRKNGNSA